MNLVPGGLKSCGSGTLPETLFIKQVLRIRDWVRFDPGIRDGRKSASGSGMNNPDHIFYELGNHLFAFLGIKILKFFEDPGWKKVGSGIRHTA
jgi:hypothetical protein